MSETNKIPVLSERCAAKNKSASPRAGKALFSEMVAARDSSVRRTIRAPEDNNCYRTVAFRSQAIEGRTPPSAVVIGPDLSGFRRLSNRFRHTAPGRAASRRRLNAQNVFANRRRSEAVPALSGQVRSRRRPLSRTALPIAVSRCLSAERPLSRLQRYGGGQLSSGLAFGCLRLFGTGSWRARPQPAVARPLPKSAADTVS